MTSKREFLGKARTTATIAARVLIVTVLFGWLVTALHAAEPPRQAEANVMVETAVHCGSRARRSIQHSHARRRLHRPERPRTSRARVLGRRRHVEGSLRVADCRHASLSQRMLRREGRAGCTASPAKSKSSAYTGDESALQARPASRGRQSAIPRARRRHAVLLAGDTWWMGLCHRLHWPDEFKTLAADRKTEGFQRHSDRGRAVSGHAPVRPARRERGRLSVGSRSTPAFAPSISTRPTSGSSISSIRASRRASSGRGVTSCRGWASRKRISTGGI